MVSIHSEGMLSKRSGIKAQCDPRLSRKISEHGMNQSIAPTAAPADPPAKLSPLELRTRWLGIRVGMAMTSGFATAVLVLVAVFKNDHVGWLVESQYLQRGGWLLDFYGDIRWSRVWLLGMMIGAVLPNVTLSERWTRILLGGLTGIPVALWSMAFIDAYLAERAIATAFASIPESSEPMSPTNWQLYRPRPGRKGYPTAHDRACGQTSISGLVCGLLAGCALATTGRTRKLLAATTVIISIVLSTLIVSKMNSEFESYVDRVQATIGKPRG